MLIRRAFALLVAAALNAASLPQGNRTAEAAQKKRVASKYTMFLSDGTPVRTTARKLDRLLGKTQKQRLLVPAVQKVPSEPMSRRK